MSTNWDQINNWWNQVNNEWQAQANSQEGPQQNFNLGNVDQYLVNNPLPWQWLGIGANNDFQQDTNVPPPVSYAQYQQDEAALANQRQQGYYDPNLDAYVNKPGYKGGESTGQLLNAQGEYVSQAEGAGYKYDSASGEFIKPVAGKPGYVEIYGDNKPIQVSALSGNNAPAGALSLPPTHGQAAPTSGPGISYDPSVGAAALEQARAQEQYYKDQLELQKQTAAEQHKMDMDKAINDFNKQWEDYSSAHYYGAMYGPGYFLNPGASEPIARPIPSLVQEWYKDNNQQLPTQAAPLYAGYTGSLYVNAEHPGIYNPAPTGIDPVTGQKLAAASVPSSTPSTGNHVPSLPLGPELTGLSGYGSLVTANGTPIPLSEYQKSHLDDTSLQHYASYLGDVAGFNPKDFMGNAQPTTTGIAMNLQDPNLLHAPTNYNNAGIVPPVMPNG